MTAVRNASRCGWTPSYFGSLPSDACTLGAEQSAPDYGPDRIVKRTYDPAGRVTLVQSAYGVTGVQSAR